MRRSWQIGLSYDNIYGYDYDYYSEMKILERIVGKKCLIIKK